MTRLARGVALAAALSLATASAGCGPNPLIGSWVSNTVLGETPPEGSSATTTYSFGADQAFNILVLHNYAATGSNPAAGCTVSIEIQGLRWASPDGSNGDDSIAITGTASAFDEVTGCNNGSMSHLRRPSARYSVAYDQRGTYTITGQFLTLSLATGAGVPAPLELRRF